VSEGVAMKIEIKRATASDKELLLVFRYLLRKFEAGVEKTEGFTMKDILYDKKILTDAIKKKNVYFFIAYYNDIPVGYSKMTIKKVNNEVMGHMGADFVLDSFRSKGIGRRLMKARLDVLRKKGIKKASLEVYKTNKLSIVVQKKFGFKIVERDMKGKPRIYRMEKELK
jgi:GNAT superfamily N-acetyltransferase